MTLPMVVPDPSLPGRVTIWEVGPRDGLQNESCVIDTQTKIEFIDRLSAAGLGIVEATSLESAIDADVRDIAIFASATESFAQRNLGRGYDAQWEMFEPVTTRARAEGLRTRGYLSMCFGDPWEGAVPAEQVVTAALRLQDLGCDEISLGDTIGVATPGQVGDLVRRLVAAGVPLEGIGVHFHDTYGQALANTLAALREGVTTVDASAGGLGGCPYAVSATGNLATEDLVYMLDGLGISHGVDLAALIDTTHWLEDHLGRPSPSRVVRARTPQKEQ